MTRYLTLATALVVAGTSHAAPRIDQYEQILDNLAYCAGIYEHAAVTPLLYSADSTGLQALTQSIMQEAAMTLSLERSDVDRLVFRMAVIKKRAEKRSFQGTERNEALGQCRKLVSVAQ